MKKQKKKVYSFTKLLIPEKNIKVLVVKRKRVANNLKNTYSHILACCVNGDIN